MPLGSRQRFNLTIENMARFKYVQEGSKKSKKLMTSSYYLLSPYTLHQARLNLLASHVNHFSESMMDKIMKSTPEKERSRS